MMMKWKRQLEACPEENPINSAQRYSGAGACKKKCGAVDLTQKLLRLGYLLAGANLDFGEAPEEEPQGPKLVNKRFSSGCCARLVGVTCQKKNNGQPRDPLRLFGRNKKENGRRIRTGDCIRSCWPWGTPPMTGGTMT